MKFNSQEAFHLALLPNDGVGLAREEFNITTYIKIHPLAADASSFFDRAAEGIHELDVG